MDSGFYLESVAKPHFDYQIRNPDFLKALQRAG